MNNLEGKKFGKLTVESYAGKDKYHFWNCLCDCGKRKKIMHRHLIYGETKSCGCLQKKAVSESNSTHGYTKNGKKREYRIWLSMKGRCSHPDRVGSKYLSGRNITVCAEWNNSFENFINDMGNIPSERHTLDRLDNDLGYSKENCRWATIKEQANNKRNNVVIHTSKYGKKTVAELSELTGIPYMTIYYRIFKYRWDHNRAIS